MERDDFAPDESKSVPQRLKPSSAETITARLNPCPSFNSLFPSLSGAVQTGQPKNLIWALLEQSSHTHSKAVIHSILVRQATNASEKGFVSGYDSRAAHRPKGFGL